MFIFDMKSGLLWAALGFRDIGADGSSRSQQLISKCAANSGSLIEDETDSGQCGERNQTSALQFPVAPQHY